MKWIKANERLPPKNKRHDRKYFNLRFIHGDTSPSPAVGMWQKNGSGEWEWNIDKYGRVEAKKKNIEWLDEPDHSDEEVAFNAAREAHHGLGYSIVPGKYEYPTFTDYLKSKQEQESNR